MGVDPPQALISLDKWNAANWISSESGIRCIIFLIQLLQQPNLGIDNVTQAGWLITA
jgi:hypothetical protein